jgi:hypothetical protein
MKRRGFAALVLLAALSAPSAALAEPINLFEVAFNVDGTGYSSIAGFQPNLLDAGTGSPFDVSAFDFSAGLGTIQLVIDGAGAHSIAGFFDLELSDQSNSAFDDEGAALGSPDAGESWEIDEPGYAGYTAPMGDIYFNVFGGALENASNLVSPDDVSMALSMAFVLGATEQAVLTFSVTENDPGGFRLRQFDASGADVYLSSGIRVVQRPVPEPFLSLLAAAAVSAGAARVRRARRR